MHTPREQARLFLDNEKAFRLGALPTEQSHPVTATLSDTMAKSTVDGIETLMRVDDDIPPAMQRIVADPAFAQLVEALTEAIVAGRRVFLTGCGATGRLAILLEAAWRTFWQELRASWPSLHATLPNREDTFVSVMAGGDHALIRSVEGFEDSTDLGRHQLKEAGVAAGDVVVAVTEGGETSFVIGTAWQGLEAGARVFFAYNNPTEVLREHVARSREVIEEPRITKLDLFTGSMAIAGSTRMQATTTELLAIGGALELALLDVISCWAPPEATRPLGFAGTPGGRLSTHVRAAYRAAPPPRECRGDRRTDPVGRERVSQAGPGHLHDRPLSARCADRHHGARAHVSPASVPKVRRRRFGAELGVCEESLLRHAGGMVSRLAARTSGN